MRQICFYFQVHQPHRLRRYRFFDVGAYHNYYDDFQNSHILHKVADNCYLPANELLLKLLKKHKGQFKISFSITGSALNQFEQFAPEVLQSFKRLAETGYVEFLAETDAHSLASLRSKKEFFHQVKMHEDKIKRHFGQTPTVFRNTELVYDDGIGQMVAEMGYKAMLTEGAKHILGWKSPNYLYHNALAPELKLLLKNYQLSDDIAFRFSNQGWENWPLTAEKYAHWLANIPKNEEVVNLFMDYETFGEHQPADSGIFDFLEHLPAAILAHSDLAFATPSEIADSRKSISALHVPSTISWADEERDLSAWIGNELQDDAFATLYALEEKVHLLNDPALNIDWSNLQNSDHFYYMCTKFFADGDVHKYFNPYNDPYDAYTNYMNVLSDFQLRVEEAYTSHRHILLTEQEAEDKIYKYEVRIRELQSQLAHAQAVSQTVEKPGPKKTAKAETAKKASPQSSASTAKPKATKKATKKSPKKEK